MALYFCSSCWNANTVSTRLLCQKTPSSGFTLLFSSPKTRNKANNKNTTMQGIHLFEDVMLEIFGYLDTATLLFNMSLVCKHMYNTIRACPQATPRIWNRRIEVDFFTYTAQDVTLDATEKQKKSKMDFDLFYLQNLCKLPVARQYVHSVHVSVYASKQMINRTSEATTIITNTTLVMHQYDVVHTMCIAQWTKLFQLLRNALPGLVEIDLSPQLPRSRVHTSFSLYIPQHWILELLTRLKNLKRMHFFNMVQEEQGNYDVCKLQNDTFIACNVEPTSLSFCFQN